jgi:hypothetical protein
MTTVYVVIDDTQVDSAYFDKVKAQKRVNELRDKYLSRFLPAWAEDVYMNEIEVTE